MRCQGESRHINGHWLKSLIMEEQLKVMTTQEKYMELNGKVQSEMDRVDMECEVTQGGCVRGHKTFIWTLVTGNCPFQTVTAVTGTLDDDSHLFTSDMILGAFISRGLINCRRSAQRSRQTC